MYSNDFRDRALGGGGGVRLNPSSVLEVGGRYGAESESKFWLPHLGTQGRPSGLVAMCVYTPPPRI